MATAASLPSSAASASDAVSSQLVAVTEAIALMPSGVLASSVEHVLSPILSALRRECDAMAATAAAATDATPTTTDATAAGIEPPAGERTTAKQRAASSRALEEAVRSIGAIATRAGTCGDDAHALTVFCDVVAAMATTPARAGSGGDADGRGPGGEDLRAASIETLRAVIRSMATTTTTVTAPELSPSSSSSSSPRPLSGSRSQAFRTLTSDAALPALGYAVSCLLDAERAEAAKGALGSRAIRADALRCLGELVSAIDDADALAFFLPGVVSGLTRALVASAGSRPGHGSGVVAVVGDANATEAAIEALAAVVVIVMNDDACGGLVSARRRRGAAGGGAADDDDDAEAEAASTAAALRKLAARGERSRSRSRSRGDGDDDDEEEESEEGESEEEEGPSAAGGDGRSLKLRRTRRWLRETSQRVTDATRVSLSSLVSHDKPSVRAAVASAASSIAHRCVLSHTGSHTTPSPWWTPILKDFARRVSPPTPRFQSPPSAPFNSASDAFELHPDVRSYRCRATLPRLTRPLLEATLTLAGDPWLDVSSVARDGLNALTSSGQIDHDTLRDVIKDGFAELPRAVRRAGGGGGGGGGGSDENRNAAAAARATARRLIAAMRALGPDGVSRALLTHHALRTSVASAFTRCFAVSADFSSVAGDDEVRGALEVRSPYTGLHTTAFAW